MITSNISRIALAGFLLGTAVQAQVSFPSSGYSQNFNSLGTTSTAKPTGWTVWNGPGTSNTLWTNATGIIGGPTSTTNSIGLMTLNSSALTASNTPTANANNAYNAGAPGDNTNRLLASAPTSIGGAAFQLSLTNNTGGALGGIQISYDIRRFTAPTTVNELPGYWLFYSTDSGANWVNVAALNPTVSGSSGILVPNTAGVTNVPTTTINFGSAVATGGELRLRWVDDNAEQGSPDQIVGLDNVVISTTQAPPTVSLTAPTNGSTTAKPAAVNLVANADDSNGSIAKVEFFQGAVKLGEALFPGPYQFSWTGMISGPYSLTARATDNDGAAATSAAVSVTVTNPNNQPPTVAITSPTDGATIPASSLTLSASASDGDGTISKVEFFNGATKLGESTTPPYRFTIASLGVGNYTFTARATDNDGGITTSAISNVQAVAFTDTTTIVRGAAWKYFDQGTDQGTAWKELSFDDNTWASGNAELGYADSPVTTLRQGPDSPTTSVTKFITYYFRKQFSIVDASQVIGLRMNLLRDDGAVVYLNGTEVARSNMNAGAVDYLTESATIVSNADETTYFPITLPFSSLVSGNNVIAVEIHQRDNTSSDLSFDLDLITTTAGGNALPVVQITAPASGSSVIVGTAIPISATATDSDGTIGKVEFFAGSTKLGEDSTGPDYSFNWTGATAGSYNLTAVAIDELGGSSTSGTVSVTVIPGPSGTLTRRPYLNSPGHTSIVVRWRSSSSVVGRVRYGTSPEALTQFVDESTARSAHEVKLSGLSPYTRYYYSVGSALDTLTPETVETTSFSPGAPAPTAADYTFRTSPTPGTAVNTRIWIVGDCGRGSQVQANGRDAYYTSNFTGGFTGTRIPDLNLQMGDNAYNSGTENEYQTGYFNMYANIFRKMPQMSTLGNHDANNTTPSVDGNYSYPYFDMFTFPTQGEIGGVASGTEHYYSFDYGNIHFICLDSNSSTRTVDNPATTGVNEDGTMAAWLRQDLASTTATWIIAFWHHPPYSKGSHNSDTEAAMVQMRTNFNPILETGGVDLVFNGHSHNYERSVLLDGHYGTTGTITAGMKKNAGNGSTAGITTVTNGKIRNATNNFTATATTATTIPADGAYIKPLTGPRDRFGAVYNTAGMSGLADADTIDHSAMYISYNNVGTVNLDVNGNSLTCTFVQSGGATPDNFTITKQGAADTDSDGISDAYEIANGLNRYGSDTSTGTDSDGLSNFLEFAFGLNPNANDAGVVEADIPNGLLTKRGQPTNWFQTTSNGTDFRVVFLRRKDYLNDGLNYTPQFSGDLITWTNSTAVPTVIATDGDMELVTIKYPLFAAGRKARYFRVAVD